MFKFYFLTVLVLSGRVHGATYLRWCRRSDYRRDSRRFRWWEKHYPRFMW